MELEVLTGSIRGWEGDSDISSLGDIIHMGSVAIGPDHKDRYLVLFHQNLLLLSVSSRMSAFIYEVSLSTNHTEMVCDIQASPLKGPKIRVTLYFTGQTSIIWYSSQ